MLRKYSLSLLGLAVALVGGCSPIRQMATHTPPSPLCGFRTVALEVPPPTASTPAGPPHDLAAELGRGNRSLEPIPLAPGEAPAVAVPPSANEPPSSLFMSGGSLNGAFGAGFLDEWRSLRPGPHGLPEFRTVTGISTGAILATFAFIDRTAPLVGENGYALDRETRILQPIINTQRPLEDIRNVWRTLRGGAVADLSPLGNALAAVLTDDVLDAVDARYHLGRTLLVGVVDVDTGQAVALDLSEMAHRWRAEPARRADRRDCYIRAIVASSSAPLAARPVFIDNRMYVDGGVRFGTFSDEVIRGFKSEEGRSEGGARAQVFVIVNGDLQFQPECREQDETCNANASAGEIPGPRGPWTLPQLALRSNGMLINQVQRLSVDWIRLTSDMHGKAFHAVRIEDAANHGFTLDHPTLGAGTHTCAQWRQIDAERDRPVQFFPRYMHCLIDYGRSRARHENWSSLLAAPPPAPEPPPAGK